MEETVPTIHTSMVQCNIFFMTENNGIDYRGPRPYRTRLSRAPAGPRRDTAIEHFGQSKISSRAGLRR